MLCPHLVRNLLQLGIHSCAGSGELRDLGGKNRDHKASCPQLIERVDLGFDVRADKALRPAAVVETTSEKEHRIRWIDLRDAPALGVLDESLDLVLHPEAKHSAAGKGASS